MREPTHKRAVVFVDGQNLFLAVREAFGYTYPNYDAPGLAHDLCEGKGWELAQVRFYTGVPGEADNPFWNHFWTAKLEAMEAQGAFVFARELRYRQRTLALPDGTRREVPMGEEKGIDVRIAIDVIRMAHKEAFDVALVLSQDQDLAEAAKEVRVVAREQGRWIKIASAYPASPRFRNTRGIDATDWIPIDRATYDAHIDPSDYRPKPSPG
jgi:uncharacterized LabA/DUF88 family protein